ncbi:MAG: cell division protein FtsL [Anaerovoracaceae bacterium]
MAALEKRHDYGQSRGNNYGFEIKPKIGRQERKKKAMSARDRSRMLLLVAVAAFICISMIVGAAYAASINYSNNKLKAENAALLGEVESLKIEIQSANSIASIEDKAMNELGMVYPTGDQFVVLSGAEKPDNGFAALLKEQAFN